MIKINPSSIQQQRGMSTLFMATVLSITISLMSVYAAQVSIMEQRVSANHYRGKQAFEAAQAGLDIALSDLDATLIDGLINNNADIGTETDLTAYIQNFRDLKSADDSTTVGQFRVTFSRPVGAVDNDILAFNAYGYANDIVPAADNSNANQHIEIRLRRTSLISYTPPASLVAKGTVDVDDDDVTINNDDGDPMAAVWSGGVTQAGDAVIDVTNAGGLTDAEGGIYDTDAVLAGLSNDALFQNFFSQKKSQIENRATVVDCKNGCDENDLTDTNGDPLTGIIWIDTLDDKGTESTADDTYNTLTIENAFTLGSVANPVVLVVNGSLKLRDSSAIVNGMVYTSKDFSQKNDGDRGTITGSLITEGNIEISKSVTLNYDPAMFANLQDQQSMYTRIAGSWKDF